MRELPVRRLSLVLLASACAHVPGITITVEGDLRDCAIEKSLEHYDHAILTALATWKYRPATYRGQPVAVRYKFHIRIVLPR